MKPILAAVLLLSLLNACSSAPPVKSQAYAELKDHRTFEHDFVSVWKAIEEATRSYKVTDRDPSEVSVLELRKLKDRTLQTDWIYGQSRDKYQEYAVNGSTRKTYLQTRVRYKIMAHSVMGGTEVSIHFDEEVESLKSDGSSGGYSGVDRKDPTRASELLDKISTSILSAAP
jgi:predicted PilT family ATPase